MEIWFGERQFSAENILSNSWGAVSAYEQQTLRFCQRWLAGEQQFVLHTSGSTGTPKPITLHRDQMAASACLTAQAVGLQRGMSSLIALNTAYVAGIMMLVRGMEVGMTMHIVEPQRNPFLDHGPCDFTALVPMQVAAVLDDAQSAKRFDRCDSMLIGGGPVSVQLLERLQAVKATCFHTYGMTETVSHVALRRLNGPGASKRFVPLGGVELALDERGCLTICGPMTLGATVTTNDMVALAADGSFVWQGRIDNVINSGGVKVQAEKVEGAVAKAFGTDRIFVAGVPDAVLGEKVVAFVEGSAELNAREQRLMGLSRYEMPKQFVYVERFAETPTGKVDRIATQRNCEW